jgi:hypothetical protein
VRRWSIHCVIHFSGRRLLQRLVGFLLHLSFRLEEYGMVFCAVVGVTAMVLVVRRLECVWASATTTASTWHAPSLILFWPLLEGSLASLL